MVTLKLVLMNGDSESLGLHLPVASLKEGGRLWDAAVAMLLRQLQETARREAELSAFRETDC